MSKFSDQSVVKLSSFNEKIPLIQMPKKKRGEQRESPIAVDLFQTHDFLHLEAEIPGVSASDLKIEYSRNILIIRAKRKETFKNSGFKKMLLLERGSGVYSRRIQLPKSINPRLSKIALIDGLLQVDIPLIQEKRNRRLILNVSDPQKGS